MWIASGQKGPRKGEDTVEEMLDVQKDDDKQPQTGAGAPELLYQVGKDGGAQPDSIIVDDICLKKTIRFPAGRYAVIQRQSCV